jgi:thiamine biosynthesis lipoprotein
MLRRARPWLGTLVEIRVEAATPACEKAAIEAAFAQIARVHDALSFHAAGSELSQLNRKAAAHAVLASPLLAELLRAALDIAQASDGLFDPTIAPELVARGALPLPLGSGTPDAQATWRDVEIDAQGRVRFRRPLWLDFGGIAKGYAVDLALAAARASGAEAATVNAGGDLAVFGEREELVALRLPGTPPTLLDVGALRDGAAAGSATGFDPLITHFDARTRRAAHTARAVSVFAPRCLIADALTKPVLCDPVAAQALLARFHASACVFEGGEAPRLLGVAA